MSGRYKVVQDGKGNWGVLDTHYYVRRVNPHSTFAPWAECPGHKWIDEIFWWALQLNRGQAERDVLYWTYYEERGRS